MLKPAVVNLAGMRRKSSVLKCIQYPPLTEWHSSRPYLTHSWQNYLHCRHLTRGKLHGRYLLKLLAVEEDVS